MNKVQDGAITMAKAVREVLENNKPKWITIQPIADEVVDLDAVLADVAATSTTQFESQTGGYTSQKDAAFEQMNTRGFKICQRLAAWARKTNNAVVLQLVDFKKSAFDDGTETEQINRNMAVVKIAMENIDNVANYKISAAGITDLQAAITIAQPLAAVRDAVGSDRQAATAGLDATIKKLKAILNHLDELIESLLEAEDAAFEDAYFAARKVVYHRGGVAKKVVVNPPSA